MNEAAKFVGSLPASVRMADMDYPGVVARLGLNWRIVVSLDAKRYALQQRVQTCAGYAWVSAGGRSPSTLGRIVASHGADVAGLVEAAADLPADPAEAAPAFAAAATELQAVFAAQRERLRRPDWP